MARVVDEISKLPPLVTSWEIHALRTQLAEAARGERFLLQGGDCAERYDHCDSGTIANKLKILLQMSLVLALGGQRRVIRVGRFAGQYAKPRSDEFETRNGVTLPSYRGDLINAPEFTAAARTPDPQLMLPRPCLFAAFAVACSSPLPVLRCHPERVFRARRTPTNSRPPQPPAPFSHIIPALAVPEGAGAFRPLNPSPRRNGL